MTGKRRSKPKKKPVLDSTTPGHTHASLFHQDMTALIEHKPLEKKHSTISMESDWACLPEDLLVLILDSVVTLSDYVCFSAVCKPWHAFALEKYNEERRLKVSMHQPPLLFLPHNPTSNEGGETTISIYNVSRNKTYEVKSFIPSCSQRWCGSSHGWLISVDRDSTITLSYPFCSNKVKEGDGILHLPPLLPRYYHHIDKVILSADPMVAPDDYTVMVIKRVGDLGFIRVGDKEWTCIEQSENVIDVIYSKGLFYALDKFNRVQTCDISEHSPKLNMVSSDCISYDSTMTKNYIVESAGGELLQIVRSLSSRNKIVGDKIEKIQIPVAVTKGFEIFKLQFLNGKPKWVEVETDDLVLSDGAWFLDDNSSTYVSASDLHGCRSNSIYFVDNFRPVCPHPCFQYPFSSFDISIFNFKFVYGSFQGSRRLSKFPSSQSPTSMLLPIWIQPTFQVKNSGIAVHKRASTLFHQDKTALIEHKQLEKKHLTVSMDSDWACLPKGLLVLIIDSLVTLSDYVCFSAVCTSWHAIALDKYNEERRLKLSMHQPPLLFLSHSPPSDEGETTISIHSFNQNKTYKIKSFIPSGIQRYIWCGSSHGWLISVDEDSVITLSHPFCSNKVKGGDGIIRLPPFSRVFYLHIKKVILSADPIVTPDNYTVMVISTTSCLCFIRVGDKEWTCIEHSLNVADVIYSKGLFYALNNYGGVQTCDISENSPKLNMILSDCFSHAASLKMKNHIVESASGDLLLFVRTTFSCRDEIFGGMKMQIDPMVTQAFKIFKLLFMNGKPKWVEVETNDRVLGDGAWFLDDNYSTYVPASGLLGCHPNCIYFVDYFRPGCPQLCVHPVAHFNLGDESFQHRLLSQFPSSPTSTFITPIWIQPTFQGIKSPIVGSELEWKSVKLSNPPFLSFSRLCDPRGLLISVVGFFAIFSVCSCYCRGGLRRQ